jgi:hypothetical protein
MKTFRQRRRTNSFAISSHRLTRSNKRYDLMAASKKTIRRSIASLNLTPSKVSTLVTYSQGIVKGMTGNPAFPSSGPALAVLSAAVNDLQTAETAALARTKGAVALRNEKRAALVLLLQQLRGDVQDSRRAAGASIAWPRPASPRAPRSPSRSWARTVTYPRASSDARPERRRCRGGNCDGAIARRKPRLIARPWPARAGRRSRDP